MARLSMSFFSKSANPLSSWPVSYTHLGEHAHIREDGRVVLAVAVAVGADVAHQRHVEAGAAMADSLRVLGHLAVEDLVGAVVGVVDGVERAGADATAAALALVVVDDGLVVYVADGVAAAFAGAAAATRCV